MFLTNICINICIALWVSFSSAYENLALNKPAHEEYPYNVGNTDASNAVDGLKSDLSGLGGQCSVSAQYQRTSTWWVNLTSTRSIHDIRIYYRTDNVHWDASNGYTSRFLGFSIYVSNTTNKSEGKLCYKDNNFTRSTIPAVFNTTCFAHGQYVIYYNERLSGVTYPNGYSDYAFNDLCEVEVYGCPTPGYYGINCTIPCPDVNCGYCHIETGTCQGGCKPGYKGHQCELECDNGTYGNGCNKTCGHCVNKSLCNHVNGTCFEGCDPRYRGSRCRLECPNNKYGEGCETNCGHCLNMSQCHHINGTCFDGCDPGYEGQNCNQECQNRSYGYRCKRKCGHCLYSSQCDHVVGTCLQGCEEGYGGRTCNLVNLALRKPAYQENIYRHANVGAGNAVDGRKSNLNGLGGECSMSAEKQRTATWWVNLESIYSIHNIRIYYRTENLAWGPSNGHTARFLGFSIYVSNTTDKSDGKLCYKDNSFNRSTIPAVFNTTCFVHGQYIIYYNERLSGVNYPSGYSSYAYNELCEVEVYGCPRPGYYGIDCNLPCPDANCGYCHIETGTCQGGCKPGYKGHQCELDCINNKYGDGCQTNCGHCLNMSQCHHINGTCFDGCDPGYEGQKCIQECQNRSYGYRCQRKCGHCLNSSKCDHVDGTCLNGCAEGYGGRTCNLVNLALRKPAYEEKIYIHDNVNAGNAVDGNKSNLNGLGGECSISAEKQRTATWWVNLESIYSIHNIRIYHRTENLPLGPFNGHTARSLGFSIYVSNTTAKSDGKLCYKDWNFTTSTIPAVFNTTCFVHGQYVIYYNERLPGVDYPSGYSDYAYNELCEVEVYGCPRPGYYGIGCNLPCPDNCRYCHIETGTCQGCKPGYKGHQCELECDKGWYGDGCQRQCGHCINITQCDYLHGTCSQGCEVGYKGQTCDQECQDGYFGENCARKCPANCHSCNKKSGLCDLGCHPGWKGTHCTEKCNGGLFGANCSTPCGHCLNNKQCHHLYGTCAKGCDPGYMGDDCTEECTDGYFGPNCRESCNETCKSCNKSSGVCKYGCKPGWKGDFCETICDDHFYGENCSVPCGNCLKNEQCHHLNGTCFNGCMSGFKGSECIEECQDGYFGENCIRECPDKCYSCNKSSGLCDQGCHPGWKGTYCTEECDGELYGMNCSMPCGHCLNHQQCHHINGTCVTGCGPGYIGNTCTEACSNNTYGLLCLLTCGNCIDKQQCHHVTGKCPEGCAVGFQGKKCDKVQCTVQCLQPSAEPADHPSITYSVSALLAVCVIVIIFLTLRLCKHEQCCKCHQHKQPKDDKPVDTVPAATGHDVNVDDGTAYQELNEVTNQPQRSDLGHTAVNPDCYVNVEGDNSAYQALGEVTQPSFYDTPFQK
ncbi:multiple epidermal growth factor-like domains protein 10 isoform X2 [Magallana gigas]|uniref:multiple epidermal growth factor-like domains protein 10 isoform X2 n=1 Tax=Magallana gigas TaxID=29159 RepID=UPI00333EA106